jgi:hypothetical protein
MLLKTCPFCGMNLIVVQYYVVRCGNCGACGPFGSTDEIAADRWNNRPDIAQPLLDHSEKVSVLPVLLATTRETP